MHNRFLKALGRWLLLLVSVALIYRFLVQPWHMRWGASDAESTMPLAGDPYIPSTTAVSTRAITIHAPNAAAQGILKFFADAAADPRAGINERMTRLNEICQLLQTQLGIFGLRRLGYVRRNQVLFSEIAEAIGSPRAARAVASACATNPVSVVIPCHRVVRRGGGLGGYRWGIERKRRLVEKEQSARERGTS